MPIAALTFFLFCLSVVVLGRALPEPGFAAGWIDRTGFVVLLAGLARHVWTTWWIVRAKAAAGRPSAHRMQSKGPYRINRNPGFTNQWIMLLGLVLMQGAWIALLPLVLYPPVMTRLFVLREEEHLIGLYGDEARAHLERTRRW
ncbi:MAG: methyltransferase family protein [Rubricella sp.]